MCATILEANNTHRSHSPSPDFASVFPHPEIPRPNVCVITLSSTIYTRRFPGLVVALHIWNKAESSIMVISSEKGAKNDCWACKAISACAQRLCPKDLGLSSMTWMWLLQQCKNATTSSGKLQDCKLSFFTCCSQSSFVSLRA